MAEALGRLGQSFCPGVGRLVTIRPVAPDHTIGAPVRRPAAQSSQV